MIFEEGLSQFLLTRPALTALVEQRIYPMVAAQGVSTFPLIVHRIAHVETEIMMSGNCGQQVFHVEFTTWADEYLAMARAATVLRDTLSGYSGGLLAVPLRVAEHRDEEDLFDAEARLYGRRTLFEFKL